jgi:hypothetical protein
VTNANWGNTAGQAAPAQYDGAMYYDTSTNQPQIYQDGQWGSAGSGQVLGSSTGGTTSAPSTGTSDVYAMLDQSSKNVNEQLGRLDNQRSIGYGNIDSNYNSAYNRLLDSKGIADRNFGISKDQTTQDNVLARNNIDSRVRSRSTGLQRLLGNAGSGNSSAALYAAPRAAALEGTQLRQGVDRTYGRNMASIDMSQGDYQRQYNNSLTDLGNQRDQKRNEFSSGIEQTRASLLDQLANIGVQRAQAGGQTYQQAQSARAPYDSQITSLMQAIDNYGKINPVMQAQVPNFAAPNLAQYNTTQMATPQMVNQNPGTADIASPYWSLLNDRQKQTGY